MSLPDAFRPVDSVEPFEPFDLFPPEPANGWRGRGSSLRVALAVLVILVSGLLAIVVVIKALGLA